eukprot:71606_1
MCVKIKAIPLDLLSLCFSYLDLQSHAKIPLVNSEFRQSFLSPTSFNGNTFKLSTKLWQYLVCKPYAAVQSILLKFKLAKRLEINPHHLTPSHSEKVSFILRYICRVFRNLSYILIDDCYDACALFPILPVFGQHSDITLHFRMYHDMNIHSDTDHEGYFPEIAHQIQLYFLANRNTNRLKHIIYENFDDFSDIYTTNINIVTGLQKLSVINCNEFSFSSGDDSNVSRKINCKELELNPICFSECLNEIKYLLQNNDNLEVLTLSADSYSFGIWNEVYQDMKEAITIRQLQSLNVIINSNCNQNEDFFALIHCLQDSVHLNEINIEWLWNTHMDSPYIIDMLSTLVAKALDRNTGVSIRFEIAQDVEIDLDALVIECLYGMERFLVKINNKLTSENTRTNDVYSNLLAKLKIDVSSLLALNADVHNSTMICIDDIIKYVFLV